MPTYDYVCKKCGHRFEKFQKMSDALLKQCPECGGRVQRLISGGSAAIVKNPAAGSPTPCGNRQTCCGRDAPCDVRSCDQ